MLENKYCCKIFKRGEDMKKFGLVLSGGAGYGFAHIGVLKVLEKNNIPIDIVGGTSMGAIVGGLYSAGITVEEMEKILVGFSRNKIVDFNIFSFADDGLLYGKKVTNLLKKIVGDKQIEECEKQFFCIASDLISGEKYIFDKGPLLTAIRASMSVAGIFKPVRLGGKCLVDGGASDNMPVKDAREKGADKVIAVDVCTYYKKENKLKSAIDIAVSAMNLTVSNLVSAQQDKGDICIKVEQPDVSFLRFSYDDAINSIKYGEEACNKMLPEILKLVGKDKEKECSE